MVYVMQQIRKRNKSRHLVSALSAAILAPVLLSGCADLTTESEVQAVREDETVEITDKDETLEILTTSEGMTNANVLRDQLVRHGYQVEFNIQPDFASLMAQRDNGNFDIVTLGWTTVTGSPDYAVRSLYHSEGDISLIEDPYVDELITQAAREVPEDYQSTYTELEDYIVEEMAYTGAMFMNYKPIAFNHESLDPDTVENYRARELPWHDYSFQDPSLNDTKPFVTSQSYVEMTSLDPIRANDASVSKLNTNMYSRLVNLDEDDNVTSDGSLSYNHTIAQGDTDYYFILRDTVNFAAVEDGEVVDTGDLVGGEDVVYSVNRAADPESVPDHLSYSIFLNIDQAEMVTDMNELESAQTSDGSQTVRQALEEGLETPVENLVEADEDVDNQAGNYQVVRVTTSSPFPQILNHLAHVSAGIVSEEQVESVNDFEVEDYNPSTHTAYGDQAAVTRGGSFDNHLWASGPYIMMHRDNTQAIFQKNPAYNPGTEEEANISEVHVRLIPDATSSLSALRSGELDLLSGSDELSANKYKVVEDESHLTLDTSPSNSVSYIQFNTLSDERPIAQSANFRKSLLAAFDQEEIAAIMEFNVMPARTTLTPVVDTGKQYIETDPAMVEHYYQEYLNE